MFKNLFHKKEKKERPSALILAYPNAIHTCGNCGAVSTVQIIGFGIELISDTYGNRVRISLHPDHLLECIECRMITICVEIGNMEAPGQLFAKSNVQIPAERMASKINRRHFVEQ